MNKPIIYDEKESTVKLLCVFNIVVVIIHFPNVIKNSPCLIVKLIVRKATSDIYALYFGKSQFLIFGLLLLIV